MIKESPGKAFPAVGFRTALRPWLRKGAVQYTTPGILVLGDLLIPNPVGKPPCP